MLRYFLFYYIAKCWPDPLTWLRGARGCRLEVWKTARVGVSAPGGVGSDFPSRRVLFASPVLSFEAEQEGRSAKGGEQPMILKSRLLVHRLPGGQRLACFLAFFRLSGRRKLRHRLTACPPVVPAEAAGPGQPGGGLPRHPLLPLSGGQGASNCKREICFLTLKF